MPKHSRKPNAVGNILSRGGAAALLRQVEQQQGLLEALRQQLPRQLAEHCIAARLDGNTLIIFTDSPAWASRLRFLDSKLLSGLRSRYPQIANCRVRIQLPERRRMKRRRHPRRISHQAADAIDAIAETLDNPELQAALLRLSRHSND